MTSCLCVADESKRDRPQLTAARPVTRAVYLHVLTEQNPRADFAVHGHLCKYPGFHPKRKRMQQGYSIERQRCPLPCALLQAAACTCCSTPSAQIQELLLCRDNSVS